MSVAVAKLTWDDIKDRPENRLELVDGELILSPIAGWKHQKICRILGSLILPYVEARSLGEFFPLPIHVVLEPGTEYEPDLCFLGAPAKLDEAEQCYRGAPELIIEVISESNRSHDTVVKFRDYERFGVKEYWLVDPRESHVRVFHLNAHGKYELLGAFGRGERVVSRVLAELALDPPAYLQRNNRMPAAVAKLTWDDIKDRPENRLELVDGELIVSPIAARKHQRICGNIGDCIEPHIRAHRLGEFWSRPIHVILEPGTEYEPDCCFIAAGRDDDPDGAVFRGAPDLIIEVISESNRTHDTVVKFRDYERFGVREYWLVDPREWHVRVFHLGHSGHYELVGVFAQGDRIQSRILPDLELNPAAIFAL